MRIAVFGGIEWVVSDQGAHFKNRLVKELAVELKVE